MLVTILHDGSTYAVHISVTNFNCVHLQCVYRLGTSLFGVFDAASTYLIAHLTNLIIFSAISVDNIAIRVAPGISTVETSRLELLLPSNTAQLLQHFRHHFFN